METIRRRPVFVLLGAAVAALPFWMLASALVNRLFSLEIEDGHMSGIGSVFVFMMLVGALVPIVLVALIVGAARGRISARLALVVSGVPALVVAGFIVVTLASAESVAWGDGEVTTYWMGALVAAGLAIWTMVVATSDRRLPLKPETAHVGRPVSAARHPSRQR